MKHKGWMIISLLFIMLVSAACSSAEGEKAIDVFNKSSEASKSLDSLAMSINMTQNINVESPEGTDTTGNMPMNMPIKTTIDSKMQMDPIAFHQTIDIFGQTVEQYYSEDGMYMSQPGKEGWFKAPKEIVDQLNQVSAAQQTPAKQLETLQEYVDEFNLEEKENFYILSFSSKGENVQKLIEKTMSESMPEKLLPEDLLKGLTVEKASYTLTINKDTYYPEAIESAVDFTIEMNGEKTSVSQEMSGTYSQFNEVGEIKIPQEVIDNAQEMPGLESMPQ
ncbi:hypothetical protein MUO14_04345 [Halobacillus shinanisalinarum]|uniref:Lipoprotein n=1 Tax=Halobacillus shinanisalinarum TaxID=2932258 RepID=A0ABY4H219_9BACI|nr:DUF6612 family protein [Halobacillus shinanisalinarum]UOQ94200.1 hypothetical protein MUO14_04345 [Halobacillus shinanisalinarum]